MIVKCEDTQVRLPNCRPIAFPLANYWEEMDSDVKCFLWQETISTTFTIFALITVNRSFPITLINQCTGERGQLIRWSNVPIIVDNFSKDLYHSKKEPTEFLCVVVRYNWSSNFIQIFTRFVWLWGTKSRIFPHWQNVFMYALWHVTHFWGAAPVDCQIEFWNLVYNAASMWPVTRPAACPQLGDTDMSISGA